MVSIIPIPRLSLQIILKTIPTTQKINVHGIFFKRFIFRCPFLYRQVLHAVMITNVVFITCTLFVNTNLYVYKNSIVPDTNVVNVGLLLFCIKTLYKYCNLAFKLNQQYISIFHTFVIHRSKVLALI